MTLGEKVHLLRRRGDWTQRELAGHVGITTNYLARLERDEVPDPGSGVVKRLAEFLGVSTDYLLGVGEKETDSKAFPTALATAGRES
jgi:transcriptional regulator with XRE-family HTH domain